MACLPLPLPWPCVSVSILSNSISNSTKLGTTFCIAWLKISLPIFHLTSIRTGKRRKLSLKKKRFFVLVEVSTTVRWQNAFSVTNGFTLDALAVVKQKNVKKMRLTNIHAAIAPKASDCIIRRTICILPVCCTCEYVCLICETCKWQSGTGVRSHKLIFD